LILNPPSAKALITKDIFDSQTENIHQEHSQHGLAVLLAPSNHNASQPPLFPISIEIAGFHRIIIRVLDAVDFAGMTPCRISVCWVALFS
jgi:hypothetical protein